MQIGAMSFVCLALDIGKVLRAHAWKVILVMVFSRDIRIWLVQRGGAIQCYFTSVSLFTFISILFSISAQFILFFSGELGWAFEVVLYIYYLWVEYLSHKTNICYNKYQQIKYGSRYTSLHDYKMISRRKPNFRFNPAENKQSKIQNLIRGKSYSS